MKRLIYKKTLLSLSLGLLLTTSLGAIAKTDLQELSNELEIMTNILKTALRQDSQQNGIKIRKLDVTYLSGQGVVFDVTSSGSASHFTFSFNGAVPAIPDIPVPPEPIHPHDGDWDIEVYTGDWSEAVEEAMEQAREQIEEARDQIRDLRHQQRDYVWQQRDYERKKRDLEFELRNADQKRTVEIKTEIANLDSEIAEVEKKRSEIEKNAAQIEKQQQQKATERAEQRKLQLQRFLSDFEVNIADTLCKYGAGIKALPKNENISFVIKNLNEHTQGKNQIYVFKHADVNDCVRDKIDKEKLISKVDSYVF